MGQDKALLDFGGVPLILHTARSLEPLVADVRIVGSPRRYAALGLSGIEDNAHPHEATYNSGCGPLAGIATALATTNSIWNLIVACDLPYLSAEWLGWLLSIPLSWLIAWMLAFLFSLPKRLWNKVRQSHIKTIWETEFVVSTVFIRIQ